MNRCTACQLDVEGVTAVVRLDPDERGHVAVTTVLCPENGDFRQVHLCAQHVIQWHFWRRLIYGLRYDQPAPGTLVH